MLLPYIMLELVRCHIQTILIFSWHRNNVERKNGQMILYSSVTAVLLLERKLTTVVAGIISQHNGEWRCNIGLTRVMSLVRQRCHGNSFRCMDELSMLHSRYIKIEAMDLLKRQTCEVRTAQHAMHRQTGTCGRCSVTSLIRIHTFRHSLLLIIAS